MLVADTDEYVKSVLRKALGEDKANLLIDRILQGSDVTGIESLKWMDAGSVAELLRNEHPQIVAALVISTGRSRIRAASRTALTLGRPVRWSSFANWTMRMPFFETSPMSVTRPTCE